MIPTVFGELKSLPRTLNGKLDRKALPVSQFDRLASAATHVAPRTHVEEVMARIWCEVLDLRVVGIDDNFFDLGGNSLLAIRLFRQDPERVKCQSAPVDTLRGQYDRAAGSGYRKARRVRTAGGPPGSQSANVLFHLNSGFSLAKFLGGDVAVQALTIESDELFSSANIEEVAASCVQKMRRDSASRTLCDLRIFGLWNTRIRDGGAIEPTRGGTPPACAARHHYGS